MKYIKYFLIVFAIFFFSFVFGVGKKEAAAAVGDFLWRSDLTNYGAGAVADVVTAKEGSANYVYELMYTDIFILANGNIPGGCGDYCGSYFVLRKLDSDGNLVWEKRGVDNFWLQKITGYYPEKLHSLAADSTGVYLTGDYTVKLSAADGSLIWSKSNLTGSVPIAPMNGLVMLQTFDAKDISGNTANDTSGKGNNGTISGGPSPAAGISGEALSFDGGAVPPDDRVLVSKAASINDLPAMTISAWTNMRSYGQAGQGFVMSKESNFNSNGWHFQTIVTNSTVFFTVDYSGTDLTVYGASNTYPASDFNEWIHWTITWDGSASASKVHIYKNGVEIAYAPSTDGTGSRNSDVNSDLAIGNHGATWASRTFDGVIDEVRVYNRALSSSEAKKVYDGFSSAVSRKGYLLAVDSSGLYVVSASSEKFYPYIALFEKLDLSTGNEIWPQPLSVTPSGIIVTSMGRMVIDSTGLYVSGIFAGCRSGPGYNGLAKVSLDNGLFVWPESCIKTTDLIYGLASGSSGVYFSSVYMASPYGTTLNKIKPDGSTVWSVPSIFLPLRMASIIDSAQDKLFTLKKVAGFLIEEINSSDGTLLWGTNTTLDAAMPFTSNYWDLAADPTGVYLGIQYWDVPYNAAYPKLEKRKIAPPPVTNYQSSCSETNKISISWDASSGAIHYKVELHNYDENTLFTYICESSPFSDSCAAQPGSPNPPTSGVAGVYTTSVSACADNTGVGCSAPVSKVEILCPTATPPLANCACGSADNATYSERPEADLCVGSIATFNSDRNPWTWICSNSGTCITSNCSTKRNLNWEEVRP